MVYPADYPQWGDYPMLRTLVLATLALNQRPLEYKASCFREFSMDNSLSSYCSNCDNASKNHCSSPLATLCLSSTIRHNRTDQIRCRTRISRLQHHLHREPNPLARHQRMERHPLCRDNSRPKPMESTAASNTMEQHPRREKLGPCMSVLNGRQ